MTGRRTPPPCAEAGFTPLAGAAWYKRLHARVLAHAAAHEGYARAVEPAKRRLLGALRGDVVEIGPGTGVNLPFYDPGIRWTGVEPNGFLHDPIAREATRAGIAATVVTGTAEQLPLPDDSADAVVATLVLCTVHDQAATFREIQRVLRPGGRFVFIEHVAAPPGSWTRRVQRLIRPLWSLAADGCQPDRDTLAAIRAAGFGRVDAESFTVPVPVVGPHVAGVAIR